MLSACQKVENAKNGIARKEDAVRILVVADEPSKLEHFEDTLPAHTLDFADTGKALPRLTDYDATVVDIAEKRKLIPFLEKLYQKSPALCERTVVIYPSEEKPLRELLTTRGFRLADTYQTVPSIIKGLKERTYKRTGYRSAFPLLYSIAAAIIATILIWPLSTGTATEHGTCASCHQDVHREATTAKYRHSVVVDEKCAKCHIIESKNWNQKLVDQAISKEYTREALIPLKDIVDRNKKYTVKVVAWDRTSRRSAPFIIELEPEKITSIDAQPPSTLSIQNIRVEEIRHGIFSTATISWTTNEFTRAAVEYGEDKRYINVTPWEYAYSREHRVTLKGLKQGRRYHYRIILKDIFGNMIRSSDLIFDTEKPRYSQQSVSSISRGFPSIEKAEVVSIKGVPFILIRTDRPSRITITLKPKADDKTHGDGFLPPKTAQIDVCVECHRQSVSHPVGVSASSPNTVIPKNLPTLEGGIITCVTCHYPHGSDKPFFARMDFERDICIECHKKGPFI